ncbi:hypothetical protein Q9L58_004557 [Maublancomyces gigas]|uniref:Uncharacterized protein n=1 Tax=Discina gigas TaxID=1032678 RepID=A0ABR3GL51_9PEZI
MNSLTTEETRGAPELSVTVLKTTNTASLPIDKNSLKILSGCLVFAGFVCPASCAGLTSEEIESVARLSTILLPHLVVEWVGLISLSIYLCTYDQDSKCAGEVSLKGNLSVGLFPKLWALDSCRQLLINKEAFFDDAGSAGSPMVVYDVQWGSVFRCYNSTATAAVTEEVLSSAPKTVLTQDDQKNWILAHRDELLDQLKRDEDPTADPPNPETPESKIRRLLQAKDRPRKQILNVLVFRKNPAQRGKPHAITNAPRVFAAWGEFLLTLVLAAGFLSVGSFGSAALLLFAAITRLLSSRVRLQRPPLYLYNREDLEDGCMLVTAHENATTWNLYLGDRGLIDSLLNKPMVEVPEQSPLIIFWFKVVRVLQFLAVTFIAGQGGLDGICLLGLIVLATLVDKWRGSSRHARDWLRREGFSTSAITCEFAGRTEMLGAVQLMSVENVTTWMDGILAPCARRDIWLKKIGVPGKDLRCNPLPPFDSLSPHNQTWVDATAVQTFAGATLIKEELERVSRLGK